MANSETVIDVVDICNIGKSIVQLGVSEPDLEVELNTEATGTDVTGFGGSLLFVGSGVVTISPGRRFIIEQSRINLGQLQNYIDNKQIRALFLRRKLGDLTDRT
tara:strand:+ start:21533 stop:21844 length:312 start_codon:yes stop_codon:yes gene_type:complete